MTMRIYSHMHAHSDKIKTVDLATVPNPHPVAAEKTPFLFDGEGEGIRVAVSSIHMSE